MPRLMELNVEECLRRLEWHLPHVGRLAFDSFEGITVLPVNYRLVDGEVVFVTDPGAKLNAAVFGQPVAFEVDRLDSVWQEGWSVLIRGRAREIVDPDERARLSAGVRSWVDARGCLVAIRPSRITGRQIV